MAQYMGIPSIYTDISNPGHDFFTFRFTCEECHLFIDARPKRSIVGAANKFADVGVKALDGFWGKAAEAGEKVIGSEQEKEQAKALTSAWAEVQSQFRFCPSCHRTVCSRCFNESLRLCIGPKCAPDLQADGALLMYQKQRDAMRQQIEQNYNGSGAPPVMPQTPLPQQSPMAQYAQPQTPPLSMPQSRYGQPQTPSSSLSQYAQPQTSQPSMPQYAPQSQTPLPQSQYRPQAQVMPTPQPQIQVLAAICPTCARQAVQCPNCRKMATPGKFCPECGNKVPLSTRLCPRCSLPVEQNAHFCIECGTQLM